jgi:hypothetical protein
VIIIISFLKSYPYPGITGLHFFRHTTGHKYSLLYSNTGNRKIKAIVRAGLQLLRRINHDGISKFSLPFKVAVGADTDNNIWNVPTITE